MSLTEMETKEIIAFLAILAVVIISIAYKAFEYIQEENFQHDAATLSLQEFTKKHQEDIPAEELKVIWEHVQKMNSMDNGYEDDNTLHA